MENRFDFLKGSDDGVQVVSRSYGFVVYPNTYEGKRLPPSAEDERSASSVETVCELVRACSPIDDVRETEFMKDDDIGGVDLVAYSGELGNLGVPEFFIQVKSSEEGVKIFKKNGKRKKANLDIVILNGQQKEEEILESLRQQLWGIVSRRCEINHADFLAIMRGGI